MVDPSMVAKSDMRRLELETVSAEEGESGKPASMDCVFKRCFRNFEPPISEKRFKNTILHHVKTIETDGQDEKNVEYLKSIFPHLAPGVVEKVNSALAKTVGVILECASRADTIDIVNLLSQGRKCTSHQWFESFDVFTVHTLIVSTLWRLCHESTANDITNEISSTVALLDGWKDAAAPYAFTFGLFSLASEQWKLLGRKTAKRSLESDTEKKKKQKQTPFSVSVMMGPGSEACQFLRTAFGDVGSETCQAQIDECREKLLLAGDFMVDASGRELRMFAHAHVVLEGDDLESAMETCLNSPSIKQFFESQPEPVMMKSVSLPKGWRIVSFLMRGNGYFNGSKIIQTVRISPESTLKSIAPHINCESNSANRFALIVLPPNNSINSISVEV